MARSQLEPFLQAVAAHPRLETVGIVDTARRPFSPHKELAVRCAIDICDRSADLLPRYPRLDKTAAKFGVEVIVPQNRNINAPPFLDQLRGRRRADVALSLGCLQIFRPERLECFAQAVNFHNGLLPDYRGLSATGWSLYYGEKRSGISFHRITPSVDAGAVLVDGAVDVDQTSRSGEVERRKLTLAAKLAPQVLEAIDQESPGRTQTPGEGRYHSAADGDAVRTIAQPDRITKEELRQRLRCFWRLQIQLSDGWWEVDALSEQGRPRIELSDGSLAIARAKHLPPQLYRVYRSLRR